MTNAEFQKKLEEMYASHSFITKGSRKTFNELIWVLRQDDVDYNISIPPYKEGMGWLRIPSVKECFIPAKELAMHVVRVEFDEVFGNDPDCDEICLNVYLESEEWFGVVRWCEDDIRGALDDKGYPVTENNIEKLHSICNNHWFTDHMIEAGWEYMYNNIGYGDGWDKSYE